MKTVSPRTCARRLVGVFSACLLNLFVFGGGPLARADLPGLTRGEIDGAPYALWRPTAPDYGILLILLPGYRLPDAPREPRLNPEDPALLARHEAGWTIAATAYRRNGWVVREGMADGAALAAHLEATHGPFRLVLLQGDSMGGLIATRLIEDPVLAPRFSGALALGAALGSDPKRITDLGGDPADLVLTQVPLRPVFFVSNRNELAGPLAYVATVAASPAFRHAAAHVIERPGHVNLTAAERQKSLERLYNWVSGEPPTILGNATLPTPTAASGGELTKTGLRTRVTRVDPDFGNLDLDATLGDLQALGLDYGSTIGLRVPGAATTPFRAVIADRYGAVSRGEWVLVILPDHRLRLAINFGHAAEALNLGVRGALELLPGRAEPE